MNYALRFVSRLALLGMSLAAQNCVTNSDKPTASRRVIDRSPGVDEVPSWVKGSKRFSAADQRSGFKGFLTMEADSRPDACTHAAGTAAKGEIAALIASNVVDESGISGDEKTLVSNRLTASLAHQKLANVELGDEYWNLVEIDDGEKAVRRLECWAQVTIPKRVLDHLIELAIADITKDPALAKERKRLEDTESRLRQDDATLAH